MTSTRTSPHADPATELVVLLDEDGHAIGTTPKAGVHHTDTPLHLAFSCYVFDGAGRVLVTRRALHKPTWPGEWTNSFCGHPGPEESLADAVRRRAPQEIGVAVRDVRLALPAFRYRAVMANGVVENEMCPVFTAVIDAADGPVAPDPDEVEAAVWEPWAQFRRGVLDGTRAISPWCRDQVAQLPEDPRSADAADPGSMPPAALV